MVSGSVSSAGSDSSGVLRDQRDRGRDIEGILKQWFTFVKPNFEKVNALVGDCSSLGINRTRQYVNPQRNVADIIVPRGVENHVAMCKWNGSRAIESRVLT